MGITLVKPVANAIRILNHLSATGRAETATEVARALNINTSTCFNILRTLVSEGALSFDDRSKTYAVGIGVVRLAERTLSQSGKLSVVRPLLQRLADTHLVTITVWSLYGADRIILNMIAQAAADLQIQMRIGQRLPRFIGAFGRIIAGHSGLSEAEVRAEFCKLRWDSPPSFEEYWRDAQAAAERGWAVDDGNFARGITSVAVPVFNKAGSISHSLVATMFREQHGLEDLPRIATEMQAVGCEVEDLL